MSTGDVLQITLKLRVPSLRRDFVEACTQGVKIAWLLQPIKRRSRSSSEVATAKYLPRELKQDYASHTGMLPCLRRDSPCVLAVQDAAPTICPSMSMKHHIPATTTIGCARFGLQGELYNFCSFEMLNVFLRQRFCVRLHRLIQDFQTLISCHGTLSVHALFDLKRGFPKTRESTSSLRLAVEVADFGASVMVSAQATAS